jgi:8-oxo-dGTP diphosphatase
LQPVDKIHLEVAAGILADPNGRLLITERTGGGPFQGMWEFPGGKIAAGESAESALVRELREEIGIEVRECTPFMRLEHEYSDRVVRLQFFRVGRWLGEPVGLEAQELRWVLPGEIDVSAMLPADAPVIAALQR